MEYEKMYRVTITQNGETDYGMSTLDEKDAIRTVEELEEIAQAKGYDATFGYITFYGYTPTGAMILTDPKKTRAIELRDELKSLEKRVVEIKTEMNRLQREMTVKPRYGNTTVRVLDIDTVRRYRLPVETEAIVINRTLMNEEDKREHLDIFGSVNGDWKETIQSVVYFRLNGILLHEGGGYLILEDKVLCSDEEWESIKSGNIPERLMHKGLSW